MTITGYKRLATILGVLCVLLAASSVALFVGSVPLRMRLVLASEQVKIFDEMRTRAIQASPADAAECLQYVVGYYPSGTKQETGSRLDRMVESSRAAAVREIIGYLRAKTKDDLGVTAEPWIEKYAPKN